MDIGVSANFPWFGPKFTDLARHLEQLGFESMWTGEHIIIPVEIADPFRYGVPLPKNYKHMPDPFMNFAAAAAVTSTLKFGMDVCLVTQREPLVLAKMAATLDRISNGRLIIGAGYGWIPEESAIFGIPMDERVRRSSEIIRILKTIWNEEEPSFAGEYYSFPKIHSNPKPLTPGGVPILIGSGGPRTDNGRALRRVAELADGWVPSSMSPEKIRDDLARLRQLCAETSKDYDALDITMILPAIYLGLGDKPDWGQNIKAQGTPEEMIPQYEEAGVKRLIIGMVDMVDDSAFRNIEAVAKGLGLTPRPA